jgi:ABC-type uncharacterized transport system auxiliary subunit
MIAAVNVRRCAAVLVLPALVGVLAACGSDDESPSVTNPKTAVTTTSAGPTATTISATGTNPKTGSTTSSIGETSQTSIDAAGGTIPKIGGTAPTTP